MKECTTHHHACDCREATHAEEVAKLKSRIDDDSYKLVAKAIEMLCILCAANSGKTIDCLTGYLFDEEEAGILKRLQEDRK